MTINSQLSTTEPKKNKNKNMPWLVCFSGLSAGLRTERLQVRFPVRARAWVVGQVPIWGVRESDVSLPLFLPPFLSLKKKNK